MKRIIGTLFALSVAFVASSASFTKAQTEALNDKIKDYDYVGVFSENRALVTKNNKSGFINKSGEVVIPLQFENVKGDRKFRNGLWCDESVGVIDSMGNRVVPEGKVIRIDRLPSCYEPTWRINECSYFKPVDIIQIETEPGKKVTYCFEYGKLLFTMDNDCPVVNILTGEVLSITKKGKKIYLGVEELKKQGFQDPSYGRLSREVRECLVMKKDGKCGVVDMNFNVVCPFNIEGICEYIDGTVLYNECFILDDSELGRQVFPLTTTIYRNNKILADKLCDWARVYGKYLFFDGYSDPTSALEDLASKNGFQIPESAKQKKLYTLDGKEVNPMIIPVGQNRLRLVVKDDISSWMYEDAKGNAIIEEPLHLVSRTAFSNRIIRAASAESQSKLSHICIDVVTGDTAWIPEDHPIFDYLGAGILKFSDLSKYHALPLFQYLPLHDYDVTNSPKDNELNVKFMYNQDYKTKIYKIKNVETGEEKVFQEVSSFSDELLRVKYKNRWYFLNDKGEGIK